MQTNNISLPCLEDPVARFRIWWQYAAGSALCGKEHPSNPEDEFPTDDDPDFRADLVARIRKQIAEGTYGTEEQWDAALEKLWKDLEQK